MAEALGVSKSTVQRVWAQARLKAHRLDRYMASNDPLLERKADDILGLYMMPLSPGRAERHGFEYYRHGTLSQYAVLDVKTGLSLFRSLVCQCRHRRSGHAGLPPVTATQKRRIQWDGHHKRRSRQLTKVTPTP